MHFYALFPKTFCKKNIFFCKKHSLPRATCEKIFPMLRYWEFRCLHTQINIDKNRVSVYKEI